MNSIQDETDLLSAVYDGPFEQPMWQTFLDRLRQRTRADFAEIAFHPPGQLGSGVMTLRSGSPSPVGLALLCPPDTLKGESNSSASLREERVYSLSELMLPGAHVRDPSGIEALRVMRITEPGGMRALLGVMRSKSDFVPTDGAVLSRIAPHFRRALRSYAEMERQKSSARSAEEVIARLNFGWIKLDGKGVVLEESASAAALLRHGAGLRRTRSGRLIAADPQVDRKLSAAMRSVTREAHEAPRALNISREPWVDLLLLGAPPGADSATDGAAMIAFIQGDSRSPTARHEQLEELFGLLPSEGRLALAMSRGLSIVEAADHLGITVETARNYSKKIYAKMGARGQVDLVRFILTGILSLA